MRSYATVRDSNHVLPMHITREILGKNLCTTMSSSIIPKRQRFKLLDRPFQWGECNAQNFVQYGNY